MTTPITELLIASEPWARVEDLAGRDFLGSWFSPTPQRNSAFDDVTYVNENPHPLQGGNFPDGLLEGFYQVALLDHLVNEVLFVDDARWSGWNYGLDRVRFTSPLSTKNRFRVRGTVAEVTPRGDGYVVVVDCTYDVEGRDKPSMVATWRVLWTLEDEGVSADEHR